MSTLDDVLVVGRFMVDFPSPWWVAGGWSIDLALGSVSREHEDIEIGVFHSDQEDLLAYCADWYVATPLDHEWVPLTEGQRLQFPEFQLLIRRRAETRVSIEG